MCCRGWIRGQPCIRCPIACLRLQSVCRISEGYSGQTLMSSFDFQVYGNRLWQIYDTPLTNQVYIPTLDSLPPTRLVYWLYYLSPLSTLACVCFAIPLPSRPCSPHCTADDNPELMLAYPATQEISPHRPPAQVAALHVNGFLHNHHCAWLHSLAAPCELILLLHIVFLFRGLAALPVEAHRKGVRSAISATTTT